MKPTRPNLLRAATVSAMALFTAHSLQSASGTWNVDADGNWSDTTKWNGGIVADASSFTATFSTVNITADRTVTLDTNRTLTSLTFADATTASNNWIVAGTNALTLAGTTPSISVTNQTTTISAPIAGSTAWSKTGAGILVLSGTNTYTAATTVSVGVLNIRSVTALGTVAAGTTVTSGAALEIQGGITVGAEAISIAGGGPGGLNLGAIRNISGTNIYGGTVTMTAQSRINSDAGTITLNNATASVTGAFNLVVGGAGNVTIATPMTNGTGGVIKDGTGILTLSGTNTFTGATTINAGTLTLGGNAPSAAAGTLGTATSAVLLGNTSGAFDASLLTSGAFTIARTVNVQAGNTGNITIGGSGANASIFSGAITLNKAANFTAISGGTATFSGAIGGAGALTKTGDGLVILSGTNTYSGITTVNGSATTVSTLRLTSAGALGNSTSVVINNGTLTAGNGTTLEINGSNLTIGSGKTLTMNSNTTGDFRSTLLNTTGNNTWAGNIVAQGSGLTMLNAGGSTTLTVSGNITSNTGGGTGVLFVRGTGTIVLNGTLTMPDRIFNHTDTGTVIVNSTGNTWSRTQVANGQIQIGATNAFDTAGSLTFGQGGTGNGVFELNGFNQTVGALLTFATSTGSHIVRNSNLTSPSTLTFTTAPATTDIVKNAAVQGTATGGLGALYLVKNGTGRVEFDTGLVDANSWTVNAGTLAFTGTTTRILPGSLSGDASATIEKAGASILTATGTWANLGATTVTAGSLLVNNGNVGALSVSDAATFGAGLSGGLVTASSATFGSAGATTLRAGLTTPSASAPLSVSAAVTTAGTTVTVVPEAASFSAGTYKLISYGSLGGNGFSGFALGAAGTYPHMTASLVNNTVDNRLDLVVSAVDSLVWTGATNGTWNVNTTSNFKLASNNAAATFFQNDSVLFNDSGANKAITVSGSPSIGNLTFANSTGNDYTLTGSFSGPGGISKSGTGTVTLASATAYTGVISVSGGTLALGGTNSLHGDVNVTGGTLKLTTGGGSALSNPSAIVTVSGGGTFDAAGITPGVKIADLRLSGSGVGGNGALINSGAALTNNNQAYKITLLGDATIGGTNRYDLNSTGLAGGFIFSGGSFTLTKVGANESWWAPDAGSTVGPVVINAGTFGVQGSSAMASTDAAITVNSAGTLALFSSINVGRTINLNDGVISGRGSTPNLTGTINLQAADVSGLPVNQIGSVSGQTLAISGSLTGVGGFEKNDAGTLTLQSNSHTYSGNTLLSAGTLNFTSTGALPASTNLIINGGTFATANFPQTVGSLSGTGGVISGGNTVTTNQSSTTIWNGQLSGTTVQMSGTSSLTLGGTVDNNSGSAIINSGTVVFAKGNTTPVVHGIHAVGAALTLNGGTLQLAGVYDATVPGTAINLPPVGYNTSTYGDQIYNGIGTINLNGGTLDLNGRQEAVNAIASPGGAGSVVTNTSATASKLYFGHQNGTGSFGGSFNDGVGTLSLEKLGTGTQTLTGTSNFTGGLTQTLGNTIVSSTGVLGNTAITVNAGTFTFNGTHGTGAIALNGTSILAGAGTSGGTLTAASGTTVTIGTASSGNSATTLTLGGLTFSGGAIINADFTGSALDQIALGTGALNLSGSNTVNVAIGAAGWVTGSYPLIGYGTLASGGAANLVLGTSVGHNTVGFSDTGTSLNLNVTAGTVTWNGNVSGVWDNNGALNWVSSDSKFLNGDNVLFDDTAAGPSFSPTVTTANVTPASVTFNNTANNYTLGGGTLGIAGAGTLFKQGTGTVTLTNANTYTGATNVQAGTLVANYNSGTATTVLAAASAINISSGATFKAIANDANFTLANNVTGAGTLTFDPHATADTAARDVTITGSLAGFTGTINLAPTVFGTGGFRVAVDNLNDIGAASTVNISAGGQAFITAAGTYASNFNLSGTGYVETAGRLGAIRSSAVATYSGIITVNGSAKFGALGSTATFTNSLTGGALTFGGSINQAGETMVITGNASGLTSLTINDATATSVAANILVNVGNGTASGTLGSIPVFLQPDGFKSAILRFDRTDGYSLGNSITLSNSVAANNVRALVQVETTGTGFSTNGQTINLGGTNALTDGSFRIGSVRAGAIANVDSALTAGSINVSVGATGGVLNISGAASINTGNFFIGESTNFSGAVNQTGGAVSVGSQLRVAHWGTETSTYSISGGTLTLANVNTVTEPSTSGASEQNGGIYLGIDGTGSLTQTGGTVTTDFIVLDNRGDTVAGANMPTGIDTYSLSAGTLALRSQWGITQRNTSTAVALSGGTIQNGGTNLTVRLDMAPDISGPVTLDTVSAGNKFNWTRDAAGSGSLALSGGGTLQFTTTGTQSVSVAISGTGAVEKLGTGTTTLSGTNTYNGATTLTAGRLNITGVLANSALTAASGTTLGGEGSAASVTLNGTTIVIDPNTAGALTATSALTATGTNLVGFTSLPSGLGPFTVVNYGTTFTGAVSNFALSNPGNFRTPIFTDTGSGVGPGAINLDFATADLIWTGTGGATWNIATTTNWNDSVPAASAFFTGDRVLFDDSSATTAVTLAGSLQPGSVIVSSATNNFTLTASSGNIITGGTSLVKSGASTLTMAGNVANTFTGGSTIAQGTVNIQHIQSLGTGAITLNDATTGSVNTALYLDTNRPAGSTYVSNITVSNNGTGTSTLGSRSSVTGIGVMGFQNITLARDVILDSNAADRTDYNNITGTGNVTVIGTGRTLFMSANTFVGDLTISTTGAGTFQIGTASAALNAIPDNSNVTVSSGAVFNLSVSGNEAINGLNGSGTVGINLANSTLTVGSNNGGGSFSGILQGSGANTLSVAKAGSGTQILSGTNTYGGTTTVTGGTLQVGSGGASGQLGTGAVSLATGTTLDYNRTGSVTQSGALNSAAAGAGTLAVEGGAALTLATAGNFSGQVNVLNGSLVIGVTNPFSTGTSAPNLSLSPGTTLTNTNSSNYAHFNNVTLDGATWTTGSGVSSFGGSNYQLNGTLNVVGSSASVITRDAGRGNSVSGVALNGNRTFNISDATGTSAADLTVSTELENPSAGTGALTKSGAGTMVLAIANNYTGGTTINAGTLGFANGGLGTTGSIAFSGSSTLRWETGNTQDVSARLAAIGTGITATLDTNGNDIALASVLSGAGSLAKNGAGNLTLSGNNTYTGGTAINGGTATAGNVNAFGNGGTITLATGATLNLNSLSLTNPITNNGGTIIGSNGSATIAQSGGTLSGSIGGVITASGTVGGSPTITGTIQGTATFTGAVTIDSGGFAKGTGNFSGGLTINSGGTLSPGNSPGTTAAGNTVWNGGGNYEWELNSVVVNPGNNQDFLNITGTLTINATSGDKFNLKVLSLTGLNAAGAVPDFASAHPGYTWTIVTASGGITGFDADAINIDLTNFVNPNVLADWQVQNIGNDISLVYVPEPSTYAAFAGLAVLGLAWNRRRLAARKMLS